ncbi:MAG: VRR-NUC domain-containing protein [Mycobacterium sp.]
MTENDLLNSVMELCAWLQYPAYHTHDSRRSVPGFPDLVIAIPGEKVLYRELKTDKGRISPTQAQWIEALTSSGADVGVWRVSDWHSGVIRSELVIRRELGAVR